ncbi:hypothetical protein ACFV2U_48180 [Streptomyces sp. NPDC059697]|uniref:hypothetical protein n=1 Tax=Streptomyces sp. NPDC059697 TaxID=3346912 RepID=UPI0036991163
MSRNVAGHHQFGFDRVPKQIVHRHGEARVVKVGALKAPEPHAIHVGILAAGV